MNYTINKIDISNDNAFIIDFSFKGKTYYHSVLWASFKKESSWKKEIENVCNKIDSITPITEQEKTNMKLKYEGIEQEF